MIIAKMVEALSPQITCIAPSKSFISALLLYIFLINVSMSYPVFFYPQLGLVEVINFVVCVVDFVLKVEAFPEVLEFVGDVIVECVVETGTTLCGEVVECFVEAGMGVSDTGMSTCSEINNTIYYY